MLGRMRSMSRELSYEDQQTIRSDGEIVLALEGVVSRLKATRRVKYKGKKVSKEAVVNASWLMLADMPMEVLETQITKYLARLEALLGHGDPGAQGGTARSAGPPDAEVLDLTGEEDEPPKRRRKGAG